MIRGFGWHAPGVWSVLVEFRDGTSIEIHARRPWTVLRMLARSRRRHRVRVIRAGENGRPVETPGSYYYSDVSVDPELNGDNIARPGW